VPGSIWQNYFSDIVCHLFFWLWGERGKGGGFINFLFQKRGLVIKGGLCGPVFKFKIHCLWSPFKCQKSINYRVHVYIHCLAISLYTYLEMGLALKFLKLRVCCSLNLFLVWNFLKPMCGSRKSTFGRSWPEVWFHRGLICSKLFRFEW